MRPWVDLCRHFNVFFVAMGLKCAIFYEDKFCDERSLVKSDRRKRRSLGPVGVGFFCFKVFGSGDKHFQE